MPLYMMRWPDGSTNLVAAPTKQEAFLFADGAWGDPYGAEVTVLKRFAMDLTPKLAEDDGDFSLKFEVEVGSFGGSEKFNSILNSAYPIIHEAIDQYRDLDSESANLDESKQAVRDAFTEEMDRELDELISQSEDPHPMTTMYVGHLMQGEQ